MKVSEISVVVNIFKNLSFNKDTDLDLIVNAINTKNKLIELSKDEFETIELLQKNLGDKPTQESIDKINNLYDREIKVNIKKLDKDKFFSLKLGDKDLKESLNLMQIEILLNNVLA